MARILRINNAFYKIFLISENFLYPKETNIEGLFNELGEIIE